MLYWPINVTHAKVIKQERSDDMIIRKISIVGETQVFEYVKNSDTGHDVDMSCDLKKKVGSPCMMHGKV